MMGRIRKSLVWGAAFFFAFVCTVEVFAGPRSLRHRIGVRQAAAEHVVAYAALQALDRGEGWGRFIVHDAQLPSGEERKLRVAVFGLEPEMEYRVEADGIELGSIITDGEGDGSLKLKTQGRSLDEILRELPPAEEMISGAIRDGWGAVVLDGYFKVVREHVSDATVYCEKVHLEDETGGDAKGMAAVCRKESGAQGFETMAGGLEPGLLYKIVVDTNEVGIVTADEEGQAGLVLRDPADEGLLPDVLKPVEEIRSVQWFQGELLLLAGVFTGESDCDNRCRELEGRFAGLTDDGFILRKGDDELEIVVTDETSFEGIDNLEELEEDDWLEVEVCRDGDLWYALSVELEDDERECDERHGFFVELTENGFVLRIGGPDTGADTEVVVTDQTEFEGFESLEELEEGDRLEVQGCWDGEHFVARSVELEESEQECETLRGEIVEMTDLGFVLRAGDHTVEVRFTEETHFSGMDSLDELDEGDVVKVRGCFDGESLLARWVGLIEDDDCVELRGVVVERTDRGLLLEVEGNTVEVAVTSETRLTNFDSLNQLNGGEVIALEGCFDDGVVMAAWILLLEDDDCDELHGTVAERTDLGFVLQVGDDFVEVAVTDETELKGFDSLDQLDGGEVVLLEGCFDDDLLVAYWVKLLEDDDCVELEGVVAERTEHGFVLQVGDDFVHVTVTGETDLVGFDSLNALDGGEVVVLEGCFEGDFLVAYWVRLLEDDDALEWWVADGKVVDILENGFVFEADGEVVDVIMSDETVLDGYDSAEQIAVDHVVLVEGWCDGEKVYAELVVRGDA
jgi:hypothetical protein